MQNSQRLIFSCLRCLLEELDEDPDVRPGEGVQDGGEVGAPPQLGRGVARLLEVGGPDGGVLHRVEREHERGRGREVQLGAGYQLPGEMTHIKYYLPHNIHRSSDLSGEQTALGGMW